jgi:hypothetical protein
VTLTNVYMTPQSITMSGRAGYGLRAVLMGHSVTSSTLRVAEDRREIQVADRKQ